MHATITKKSATIYSVQTEKWKWWSAPSSISVWKCSSSWYFTKTTQGEYVAKHPILMAKGNFMHRWNRPAKTKGRALRKIRRFLHANFISFSANKIIVT